MASSSEITLQSLNRINQSLPFEKPMYPIAFSEFSIIYFTLSSTILYTLVLLSFINSCSLLVMVKTECIQSGQPIESSGNKNSAEETETSVFPEDSSSSFIIFLVFQQRKMSFSCSYT